MNNYHTHTWRCRHGNGDIEDYARAAIRAELGLLGFSDHGPLPDNRWLDSRMRIEELPGYIDAIDQARADASITIPILSGLEADWVPEYATWYREECLGRLGMDYLAAGVHYYRYRGEWEDSFSIRSPAMLAAFASSVQKALASGLFAFLAHPDVYCSGWLPWDADAKACARDILAAAEDTRVPLEVNCYGLRKPYVHAPEGRRRQYPHPGFWELASAYDVQVLVNSDAHTPPHVAANLEEGYAFARQHRLHILDSLELKKPATPGSGSRAESKAQGDHSTSRKTANPETSPHTSQSSNSGS